MAENKTNPEKDKLARLMDGWGGIVAIGVLAVLGICFVVNMVWGLPW